MRALLVANANDCDAGYSGERFRHHGYSFLECHRERPHDWPSLDGIDLVLLMGSEWSVFWPDIATEVSAELALINSAQSRGVPIYGICYGAQSIAKALGGTVERGLEPEIGWYDNIDSDFPAIIASGPWLQWHYDVITVPPHAEELARSTVGPQAWRLGRSLATQFHPEATETMLARWTTGAGAEELARIGVLPAELMAETRANVVDSRVRAEGLVDWFLDSVAGA